MGQGITQKNPAGSGLNFEVRFWFAADKVRGRMDSAEFRHVCLGLILLKCISDAFEEKREQPLFNFSGSRGERFAALLLKLLSGGLRVRTKAN